jgi:signal transduction histidine kinase
VERQDTQPVALPPNLLEGLDVTVPIGQFGSLRIGLSPTEMERRIGELRRDLVRQTAVIGSVTLVIVVLAFGLISTLARRGQRLATQAAEAERLAELGRLAAGLAHEIRNPLNSLNLNMQMLEEDIRDTGPPGGVPAESRRGKLFEITKSEIGRLERLVTDFLSYARPRPLHLQNLSARDLVERTRAIVAREFTLAGVLLETRDESGGAFVRVDPEPLQQLLLNLLQNALAATEGTGRERRVTLAARRDGPQLLFEIADNGVGIPYDEQGRIFEIFYSTRKGGTGLGLAIADRVARAHAGEITFESLPGAGTTFRVALPVATGAESS